MPSLEHFESSADVARAAVEHMITILSHSIKTKNRATWVLAGGSSPAEAYALLASDYADALDWSRVTVLIGDERIVPFTSPDSNWGSIRDILFASGPTSAFRLLPPTVSGTDEEAAIRYAQTLDDTLKLNPCLDLVWLGVGPDGHTLSLAPDQTALADSDALVVAVHDFPKPPPDRLSLTLKALGYADQAVVFATGAAKRDVLKRALDGEELPIARASRAVETSGGTATWLFDSAARS